MEQAEDIRQSNQLSVDSRSSKADHFFIRLQPLEQHRSGADTRLDIKWGILIGPRCLSPDFYLASLA